MRITSLITVAICATSAIAKPFGVHVVDDQTGRGVPLVELKTTSQVKLYTDSAGWVAIDDPALLGRKVYFDVGSHGYEFPVDGFGSRGVVIELTEGGERELKIHRLNIAERLYRLTGEGIYRDSVILGKPVPIEQPLINGRVAGQDSVQCALYQDKIWWLWGDTNDQGYKMGQFSMSGATSDPPGHGGLDPAVGVNLKYFVDQKGFSRSMVPPENSELHWLEGLVVVPDETGKPRMVGSVNRLKSLSQFIGRNLAVYDDATGLFEPVKELELKSELHLRGHPFHHTADGVDYLYFGDATPNLRVKADWKSVTDPATYEALVPIDDDGHHWAWRRGEQPPTWKQIDEKLKSGKWNPDDVPTLVRDAAGKIVRPSAGSVCWNAHRHKWDLILGEFAGGPSMLGEIWCAESDAPEGPWRNAVKIVTHDKYSFYNPVEHPFFAQDGGRVICFEGTYTATFSRDESCATPRYDYNQMMYRLDLDDPRLRGEEKHEGTKGTKGTKEEKG